jgi:hypothetical protein
MISQEPAKREKERQWWLITIGLGGGRDIELGEYQSFYIVQFLALLAKARILCLDSLYM